MSWTLSDIRSAVRSYTRRSSTGELSNADILAFINDFYRYQFPLEVNLDRLDDVWTQQLTATDDGEYSVSGDYIELTAPFLLNGGEEELQVYYDQGDFWRRYPPNEDYLTAPSLAVGSSNAAHVAYSAFAYSISGYQYSVSAGEVALSGDAVPVNKYGAWMITIDEDGDLSITAASDNATGYTTPGKAVEGIATADVTDAIVGFVTAICSAGSFTPGTTELNAGASVTATFTDGNPDLRARPEAILLTRNNGKLYVRPKANDLFQIDSAAVLQRPTALSDDTDTPLEEEWGRALALGASIQFLMEKEGEMERITELGLMLSRELSLIRRNQQLQQKPEIERVW